MIIFHRFTQLTLFIIAAVLFTTVSAHAVTVDGRIVVLQNDGTTYSVKVQIKVDTPADMGGATLQFSYNSTALNYPNAPTSGVDYTYHNFTGGLYSNASVTKTIPNGNTLSLNIELFVDNAGNPVATSWTDVATLHFTVSSPIGNSNLQWGLREVYHEDNATLWTTGTWLGENTNPLPVELISFSAVHLEERIALTWATATELDNYGFQLERSLDKSAWEVIAFVPGKGSKTTPTRYWHQDVLDRELQHTPVIYYRLKQIDRGGAWEYSNTVSAYAAVQDPTPELYPAYPNPFNPSTTLGFYLPEEEVVNLSVFDNAGKRVAVLHDAAALPAGYHSFRFDAAGLPSGIYHAVLITSSGVKRRSLVFAK